MSTGGADGPARPGPDRPHETNPDAREASAPWERPRRWAHEKTDATRVEDLLTRLSGTGLPSGSRRQRRTGDEAGDTVPAGELIAALSAAPDGSEGAPQDGIATGPQDGPEGAPQDGSEITTSGAEQHADPSAMATILPAAAARPPAPEARPPAGPDESWQSVLASLRRQAGETAPIPPVVPGGAAGRGGMPPPAGPVGNPGAHADHPHRGWLVAGRSLVAMLAVLLLLAAGTEWVIKARADAALASRDISAVVPDDTNISVPTATRTDSGPTGAAAEQPNSDGTAKSYQAENILLMGSDTRSSAEDVKLGGGGTDTMQSDVLMIAHLSADRSHVTVVSIPRDLYVAAPTCKAWDYTTNTLSDKDYVSPYGTWKITNAYAVGGAQCTVRAVQQLTGLRINRVIIIDFAGFKSMVDALGGITVTACRPIIDGNLGTVLAEGGTQHINGTQALNLVRAREVRGDTESDLARIRRQQKVLSTMLRQATTAGVLLNPAKLNSLLQAFVHNVRTDNVTLDDLLEIAQSLGNLDPARVTFYTLPTRPDGQGLQMAGTGPLIWNALVNDQPLPGEVTRPPTPVRTAGGTAGATGSSAGAGSGDTGSAAGSSVASTTGPNPIAEVLTSVVTSTPTGAQTLSVPPDEVNLQVVNVAGRGGVATQAMTALNELGFRIAEPDLLLIPGDVRDGVTVEYSEPNRAAALTVAAAVPGAALQRTDGLGDRVRLMLGSRFDGTVTPVTVGEPVPTALSTTPSPVLRTRVTTRIVTPQGPATLGAPSTPSAPSTPPASAGASNTVASGSGDNGGATLTSGEVRGLNAGNASCI